MTLPFLISSQLSSPLMPLEVSRLSPSALAYLGDAVYELFVRTQCLLPPSRTALYHQKVVACVKAETQAYLAQHLQDTFSDIEQSIFRQGRNAARRGPKRLNLNIYQQATGLEAVMGYLYLTDPQRLEGLLSQMVSQLRARQQTPPGTDSDIDALPATLTGMQRDS